MATGKVQRSRDLTPHRHALGEKLLKVRSQVIEVVLRDPDARSPGFTGAPTRGARLADRVPCHRANILAAPLKWVWGLSLWWIIASTAWAQQPLIPPPETGKAFNIPWATGVMFFFFWVLTWGAVALSSRSAYRAERPRDRDK